MKGKGGVILEYPVAQAHIVFEAETNRLAVIDLATGQRVAVAQPFIVPDYRQMNPLRRPASPGPIPGQALFDSEER